MRLKNTGGDFHNSPHLLARIKTQKKLRVHVRKPCFLLSTWCPQSERGCRKSLSGQVEGDKLGLFCGMKVISELLQRSTAVSSRC